MKKLLSLLLISIFTLGIALANPVTEKKAQKAAVNVYMNYAPKSITNYKISKVFTTKRNGITTFFTFVFKSGGFVIIAADDASIPVLAYSHNSTYRENITNLAAKEWFDNYSIQIEDIKTKRISNSATIEKWDNILNNHFPKSKKAVEPLIKTNWDQGGTWDDLVPSGTPVGCVATAMSQIMKYWEHPTTGANWHKYTHPVYGEQSANFFATTYDYENMSNNVGTNASAILCYHCGVSVNMDYGPDGSGALSNEAAIAFVNYFKYDKSIDYLSEKDYSPEEWIAILKTDLDENRPLLYSGSKTQNGEGGHAFICDGYDDNNKFHFNWGWSGNLNAFYEIGKLNPGAFEFNKNNSVVSGIRPAAEGDEITQWIQKNSNFPKNATYTGYIDAVDNNVAWAIGRDGSGSNADYTTYILTKDGGNTWTSKTLDYGKAFSMIMGVSADIAYIAAYGTGEDNKIIRTVDGGENWEVVLSGGGAKSFFNVVHFFNENDGLVQGDPINGEFELYTTNDGGNTWTPVPGENIPDPNTDEEFGTVGLYDAVGDTIWYSTNTGYIYKSIDKGHNWTKHVIKEGKTNINLAFDDKGVVGIANYFDTQSEKYTKYKSTDGGETWTELSFTGDFYNEGISFVPGTDSTWVSVGSDEKTPSMGISYTTDAGATWQQYSNYYKTIQFTNIDMASVNRGYAGGFNRETYGGIWVYGGTNPNFEADNTTICKENTVTFTGYGYSIGADFEWSFGEGATPSTASGEGPFTVTYNSTGLKTVELSYSFDGSTYSEIKKDYIEITDCAGISNTEDALFKIYPNPSNGLFNISSEGAGNITIINAVGQIVYEKSVQQQDVINLRKFNTGVYFVRFENEKKTSTQRIIIQ